MSDLVERLRNGPYTIGPVTGEIRELAEAATHLESQAAIIAELRKALGDLVGACHEAPKGGPFDQIDNDGRYYQSADLAEKLENGRRALTKARATA